MLDIIHYFFEQDLRYSSGEEYEAVSSVRTYLYEGLYGVDYRYKATKSGGVGGRTYVSKNASFDDLPNEFSTSTERKPYVPPTKMNIDSPLPFGDVLDAPL